MIGYQIVLLLLCLANYIVIWRTELKIDETAEKLDELEAILKETVDDE